MLNLPRSTFYHRPHDKRSCERDDLEIRELIEKIVYRQPGYGHRRVTKQLHRDGLIINKKRVLRIMRDHSLLCQIRRAFKVTTNSKHGFRRYPNLAKGFVPTAPNQLWVADITYIRILTAFVYLAVILDVFSRKVIGYALSKSLEKELTLQALRMAIDQRRPPEGCIIHSDQGVQYACDDYVELATLNHLRMSMAARGNPYENAMAESFMKTLKAEEVYLWEYETPQDVLERIPFFIEQVYNADRLHSALGYIPPDEFEANFAASLQQKMLAGV